MATEKIDLNNLDKSDWKTYRFDEIAQNISERVDPNNTELEVYIGLEHIDSESLHIKRHGTPDDVNGTKLKFYKDDIIFGRRRAYQRKAGIATCDGFCSAHALVLRANPDVIDPALFPFFMHSDLFMNRAVDISVGSLSPTINWGTLKHQEFLIPPKGLHKLLSGLLKAADSNLEKLKYSLDSVSIYRSCVEKEAFKLASFTPSIKATEYFDKIADGTHDTPKKQSEGYKLLTSKNIVKNKLNLDTDYYLTKGDYDAVNKRSQVNVNDILFGMIGTVGQVCRELNEPDNAIKKM